MFIENALKVKICVNFGATTLSITTFSINDIQHNEIQHKNK